MRVIQVGESFRIVERAEGEDPYRTSRLVTVEWAGTDATGGKSWRQDENHQNSACRALAEHILKITPVEK